jgi:hypothetical protein
MSETPREDNLDVNLNQIFSFGAPAAEEGLPQMGMDIELLDFSEKIEDLNECVREILSKEKMSYEGKQVIRFCSKKASKEKRKRTRKDRA